MLIASLIIGQGLFLVSDLRAASGRLDSFGRLSGWYQMNDMTGPEEFQSMSSSPDFQESLSELYTWVSDNPDIEMLVLPKVPIGLDVESPSDGLYLVSRNLDDYFGLELAQGRWFGPRDEQGRRPVVIGHGLETNHSLNDVIAERYYVCGILSPESRCYDIGAGMQPIDLDRFMMTPIDGSLDDVGTLDGVMNGPVMRFRSDATRLQLSGMSATLGLYDYRYWRLDDFLRYYAADLRNQIALQSLAVAVILGFALSSFILGILRSISSRRREFGVHLAYGAAHSDFWLATSMELGAVVLLGCAAPLAILGAPNWGLVVVGFCLLAVVLALVPTVALARQSIPQLMRGNA